MKAYTERVFGNHEGAGCLAIAETDGVPTRNHVTYGATFILRYVTPDKAGNCQCDFGFDDFISYG